jgi:hypothetical protein
MTGDDFPVIASDSEAIQSLARVVRRWIASSLRSSQ